MLFHVRAIFNAIIRAGSKEEARAVFLDKALTGSAFHLQEKSIEVEEVADTKND